MYAALFVLGVAWTATRCLTLRSATVADLRTGRRRRTSGAGAGVGLLAGAGVALAGVVVVVTVAALFGGAITLLVFSLDRYAIGEPGARRETGRPV